MTIETTSGIHTGMLNTRGNRVLLNEATDKVLGFVRGGAPAYGLILEKAGWQVYATEYDSPDFGIFVDVAGQQILTYSNFDRTLTVATNADSFQEELLTMAEFYGNATIDFTAANPHARKAHPRNTSIAPALSATM